MKKLKYLPLFLLFLMFVAPIVVFGETAPTAQVKLPFVIPDLGQLLTFAIRIFLTVAALIALIFLVLGGFSWITSGGDKEAVKKAQDKIQNALLGLIIIVAVLAIAITLEQIVFSQQVCFGITCPVRIPTLLQKKPESEVQPGSKNNLDNDLPGTGSVGGASDENK